MSRWKGGLSKHPQGWFAYVPKPKGTGLRFYNPCKKTALKWQHEKGIAIWGEEWPDIKVNGVCRKIQRTTRSLPSRTGVKITDGVIDRTTLRITPAGTLSASTAIWVSYMIFSEGKRKQKAKTFAYGTTRSGRTRDEAIALGVALREQKVAEYQAALRKAYE